MKFLLEIVVIAAVALVSVSALPHGPMSDVDYDRAILFVGEYKKILQQYQLMMQEVLVYETPELAQKFFIKVGTHRINVGKVLDNMKSQMEAKTLTFEDAQGYLYVDIVDIFHQHEIDLIPELQELERVSVPEVIDAMSQVIIMGQAYALVVSNEILKNLCEDVNTCDIIRGPEDGNPVLNFKESGNTLLANTIMNLKK